MAHKRKYARFETAARSYCYCSGKAKIIYATRDVALAARNRHLGTLHEKASALRAYRCTQRSAWHLTSQR